MPKIRMTAPGVDKDGQPLGVGGEYDVDEETAHNLRSDGKALYVEDEQAQAKAQQEGGNFSARTSRSDAGGEAQPAKDPKEPPPGPSAPRTEKK